MNILKMTKKGPARPVLALLSVFVLTGCSLFTSTEEDNTALLAAAGLAYLSQSSSTTIDCSLGQTQITLPESPVDCTAGNGSFGAGTPTWISGNFRCITVTVSSGNMTIASDGLPSHKSGYYTTAAKQDSFPSTHYANVNTITAATSTISLIKSAPTIAASTSATGQGSIGFAVSGAFLYNNSAAPGDTLAAEAYTFDSANGHPTNTGAYHHHGEPCKITVNTNKLVGILADGFPIVGQKDSDNSTPTDLDSCNGHSNDKHGISNYPNTGGVNYHYHITKSDPFVIGCYKGTKGNISM